MFLVQSFILHLIVGIAVGTKRIFGGTPAKLGRFPMMVQLNFMPDFRHFCGGSVLNTRTVLTAAHCFDCWDFKLCALHTLLLVGDVNREHNRESPSSRQFLEIDQIIIHESYEKEKFQHDIAMLELSWPIVFSENVQPAQLATTSPPVGKKCYIAGWGLKEADNHPSVILLATKVSIVKSKVCSDVSANFDKESMICAGDLSGRHDSCQGDSGGPLICNSLVVGIISYGGKCGAKNHAAVHTDVSKYLAWINDKIPTRIRGTKSSGAVKTSSKMPLFRVLIAMIMLEKYNIRVYDDVLKIF